jgi:hypothetical protein
MTARREKMPKAETILAGAAFLAASSHYMLKYRP